MISESADLALKRKAPKLLISTTVAATLKAFLLPYARYFRSLGWTVDAMARDVASDETCLDAFDHCWDIPWSRSPLDPRNLLHAPSLIQNIVKREGYDIVHVHTPVAAFVTRFALRNRSVDTFPKIVYTAHGFHFYKGGQALRNCIFLNLEKLAGKWTDKLIVINQEDYDAAALHHIVPQEDRVYMPGIGLDLEEYRRAPASETVAKIRSELGLQADDTLFTMIAEFNAGKRHRDALQAFALIQNKHLHLALAGTGPLFQEMQELAASLKIEDRVHFLGFRRDIPELILASKATILPSEREGLSRSGMESICLGVPVIGADARGVRDLITDKNGILFPVGDVKALSEAIAKMAVAPDAAYNTKADDRWDVRSLIESHEKLYGGLLNR